MTRLVRRRLTAGSASVSRVHLVGYEEDIARFYASNEAEHLGSADRRHELPAPGRSGRRRGDAPRPVAGGSRPRRLGGPLPAPRRRLRPGALGRHRRGRALHRRVPAGARGPAPAARHACSTASPTCRSPGSAASPGINIGRRPLNLAEVLLKRALDLTVATIALVSLSPLLGGDRRRDQARQPRPGLLPAEALRLQPAALRRVQVPLDAGGGRRGVPAGDAQRQPHHPGRRVPAADQPRRAAAAPQRAAGRDVAGRPAPARPGARSQLRAPDRALRPAPQRPARHHRLGAGQRLIAARP